MANTQIASEIIGNTTVEGFVNKPNAEKGYFLIGTGSYMDKAGVKKYKSSVMVFIDKQADKLALPTEGNYVAVKGDLVISESTYKPEGSTLLHVKGTMNIRAAYQLTVKEAPKARSAAPQDDDI